MVRMIDIKSKASMPRVAKASGFIRLKPEMLQKIKAGEVPKDDVPVVAQTAAILAIKHTPELSLLTHQITITSTDVIFKLKSEKLRVEIEAKSTRQTGVEMEALVGVASELLTIWEMVKSLEKDKTRQYPTTLIEDIRVLKKVKC